MENKKILDFLKKAELSKIQLTSSDFYINVPPELMTGLDIKFTFDHKSNYSVVPPVEDSLAEKKLELFCFLQTTVSSDKKVNEEQKDETPKEALFSGSCRFVARYLFDKDEKIDPKQLEYFTQKFAFPHAYPYIRQHVENTFAQMGLVGFTLPLLKANSDHPLIQSGAEAPT